MYFEGKIKVRKTKKGKEKTVTEHYIIRDEELFANTEYKLMNLYNGDCEVTHIAKSSIRDIVNAKEDEKPFFKAVITSTFTHDNGTEKELTYPVLVRSLEDFQREIKDYLKNE